MPSREEALRMLAEKHEEDLRMLHVKHEGEKELLLDDIRELEVKLDQKQALQLQIERMKVAIMVWKDMVDEEDIETEEMIELLEEQLRANENELEYLMLTTPALQALNVSEEDRMEKELLLEETMKAMHDEKQAMKLEIERSKRANKKQKPKP